MKAVGNVSQPDDAGVYREVNPRDYIQFHNAQTSGTSGGNATAGSFETLVLNTTVGSLKGASLASNQVTLPAGTYEIRASAPTIASNQHQIRWYNTTATATAVYGLSAYGGTTSSSSSRAFLLGRFTITSQAVFELQHRVTTNKTGDGHGVASSFSVSEVFGLVELWKVG